MQSPEVLYIHPFYSESPNQIPMGVVGLLNSLPREIRRLGLFSDEVTEKHIREARIVAMDAHWYFALWPVENLAQKYKAANPELTVVVGGHTASALAKALARAPGIDAVVQGDGEPLRDLALAVLGGQNRADWSEVPNLVTRDFESSARFAASQADFDALCYTDYDFFPSLREKIAHIHEGPFRELHPNGYLPFLPISRGCPYDCEFCYGSRKKTRAVFGRSFLYRSATRVREDLERLSENPEIPSVFMVGDGADLFGDSWVSEVFGGSYNLNGYFEFFNPPTVETIERMAGAFKALKITLSVYGNHGEDERMVNMGRLADIVRATARLPHVSGEIWNPRREYRVPIVSARTASFPVFGTAAWHIPVPQPGLIGKAVQAEYERFRGESYRSVVDPIRRAFLQLSTGIGLIPPPQQYPLLDPRLEAMEAEKRLRGTLPLVIYDGFGCAEKEESWLASVACRDTTLFRFETDGRVLPDPLGNGAEGLFLAHSCRHQEGGGFRFPRGPIHCCFEGKLASGAEELIARRSPSHRLEWSLLDVYSAGSKSLSDWAEASRRHHVLTLDQPFNRCALDACKMAARACPAVRGTRLIIDGEGTVRPCFWGSAIGQVGDRAQDLVASVLEAQDAAVARRGCNQCPVENSCSKCPYPSPLTEDEFCSLKRQSLAGELLGTLSLLAELGDGTPPDDRHKEPPDELLVESSQHHPLMAMCLLEAEHPAGESPLNPLVRLALFGTTPVLIDIAREEVSILSPAVRPMLGKLRSTGADLDALLNWLTTSGMGVSPGELVEFLAETKLLPTDP